jgi:hypothetical protein
MDVPVLLVDGEPWWEDFCIAHSTIYVGFMTEE